MMVWWWIGNAVLILLVIPVVVLIANRVISPLDEIKKYADDILANGVLVTGNLDPVPALVETRRMVGETLQGVARYGAALDEIL
ncbi:MAG: hypothetical protein DWQ40_06200 [Actinobacteria bacterium]|nr:MAG: hypothetical protein DWQ40_06200 [Actinomycetota bacterium]REK38680.1 MAG: hypothetical protein DWQ20_03665 [Actinomycetota bacterium]